MAFVTIRDLPRAVPQRRTLLRPVALTLHRWAGAWRSARQRRQTRAVLASLDPALLDDIGIQPIKPGLDWAFVHGVAIPLPAIDRPRHSMGDR